LTHDFGFAAHHMAGFTVLIGGALMLGSVVVPEPVLEPKPLPEGMPAGGLLVAV
jgi:hypothetical protein